MKRKSIKAENREILRRRKKGETLGDIANWLGVTTKVARDRIEAAQKASRAGTRFSALPVRVANLENIIDYSEIAGIPVLTHLTSIKAQVRSTTEKLHATVVNFGERIEKLETAIDRLSTNQIVLEKLLVRFLKDREQPTRSELVL